MSTLEHAHSEKRTRKDEGQGERHPGIMQQIPKFLAQEQGSLFLRNYKKRQQCKKLTSPASAVNCRRHFSVLRVASFLSCIRCSCSCSCSCVSQMLLFHAIILQYDYYASARVLTPSRFCSMSSATFGGKVQGVVQIRVCKSVAYFR